MATYTHSTAARYTHEKGTLARAPTYALVSRSRPTTAETDNAKQIFGPDFPAQGASLHTGFNPATGAVSRTYRGGIEAVGSKARTRT